MTKAGRKITTMGPVLAFMKTGTCAQALINVLDRAYDHPMQLEEKAADPLAGGIVQQGYQCGMLWGATLAAGAEGYRQYGPGPKAETAAILAAQKALESFHAMYGTINCLEIVESKMETPMEMFRSFLKGGPIGCFRMASRYSPVAFQAIDTAFSEEPAEVASAPVSCACLLAQKMGASPLHTSMAAGFAGGIGLSGGGCGALGAAIWILGMADPAERIVKNVPGSKVGNTIDRFLQCTDYQFECSAIVGRKFENPADHASYLQGGGCADLIEAIAAK